MEWGISDNYLSNRFSDSSSFIRKQNLNNQLEVLAGLKGRGLTMKMDKCDWRETEIDFLGYSVSVDGIEYTAVREKIGEWDLNIDKKKEVHRTLLNSMENTRPNTIKGEKR
jgi:hypothetical protein